MDKAVDTVLHPDFYDFYDLLPNVVYDGNVLQELV